MPGAADNEGEKIEGRVLVEGVNRRARCESSTLRTLSLSTMLLVGIGIGICGGI